MKPTIRAIDTEYLGYRFRSRLEARWAHFFNTLGIAFTYEPEGFEMETNGQVVRYLPDFWVKVWDAWVEIKPDLPSERERGLAELLEAGTGRPLIVLSGVPGGHSSEACVSDSDGESRTSNWWSEVQLAECQFCRAIELTLIDVPYIGFSPFARRCWCVSPALSATSPRLRRAYEAARSCRFERLPRNLRRALDAA